MIYLNVHSVDGIYLKKKTFSLSGGALNDEPEDSAVLIFTDILMREDVDVNCSTFIDSVRTPKKTASGVLNTPGFNWSDRHIKPLNHRLCGATFPELGGRVRSSTFHNFLVFLCWFCTIVHKSPEVFLSLLEFQVSELRSPYGHCVFSS